MTYVITVEFTSKTGRTAAFRKLKDENAENSCYFKLGCQRYDVPARRTTARTNYFSARFVTMRQRLKPT
jgi:quinol monooxygenase YgiN